MQSFTYGTLKSDESFINGENEGILEASYAQQEPDVVAEYRSKKFSLTLIAFIASAFLLSSLVAVNVSRPSPAILSGNFLTMSSDASTLAVTSISNEYGIWDSSVMLPYPFLTNSLLAEPYKESIIILADTISGCSYGWSMIKINDNSTIFDGISTDGSIVFTLNTVGEYAFTASESCGDISSSSRQLSMSVWVKYVRRELSTLNDVDREEFLDAFHTLWTVSTADGIVLYGDRYKSVNYFATLHNDGGGNPVCDEFHGGLGFLNNHMYLSAYMEQSLQLVNPKVALHYLEYNKYFESSSYQKHLSNQLDGGSWTEILTSKFFGSSDPYTGRITDGRWANAVVPYVTHDFLVEEGIDPDVTFFKADEVACLLFLGICNIPDASAVTFKGILYNNRILLTTCYNRLMKTTPHLSSPYGLLRSPWNFNPSPFVTRYGNVFRINDSSIITDRDVVFKYHMGVTCDDYTGFFSQVNGQPLETYLNKMEDDTHGIFHFTFGGVGGDQAVKAVGLLMDQFNFSYSNVAALAISAQPFFKKHLAVAKQTPVNCTTHPWQNEFLTTASGPGEYGGPSCDFAESYYDSEDNLDELISYFFKIDPDHKDTVVNHINTLQYTDKAVLMKIVGNMFPFDGDLAGSGAALDPLFWVAHGAMERTFQKSVFSGIFTDMLFQSSDKCSGHDSSVFKFWLKGFYFVDESFSAQSLSNEELTGILDPTSDQYRDLINFVYDTSSFSWCADSDSWFSKS